MVRVESGGRVLLLRNGQQIGSVTATERQTRREKPAGQNVRTTRSSPAEEAIAKAHREVYGASTAIFV